MSCYVTLLPIFVYLRMTNGGGELSDEVNEPQYHRYTNIGRKGGNEGPSMASLARKPATVRNYRQREERL